jgi:hypothetical protein
VGDTFLEWEVDELAKNRIQWWALILALLDLTVLLPEEELIIAIDLRRVYVVRMEDV